VRTSSQQPIEGDYIETIEGFFFTVKGLFHPRDGVIAYLRYIPYERGSRRLGSRTYTRAYDPDETTEFIRKNAPQYLSYSPEKGLTLQIVPREKIAHVHKPRERLSELIVQPKTILEEDTAKFASLLSSQSGVPIQDFGVSGSVLIGLATPESDIDLVVYGRDEGKRVYKALKEIRRPVGNINPYNNVTIEKIVKSRWSDTDIDLGKLREIEIRKLLHGRAYNRDYFIRLVKNPAQVEAEVESRPFMKVKMRAKIVGNEESIFTPCIYQVQESKLIDVDLSYEVDELVSYRGKFTEQGSRGELVEAMGMLEKVTYNKMSLFRVVLGGRGDYMVPVDLLHG